MHFFLVSSFENKAGYIILYRMLDGTGWMHIFLYDCGSGCGADDEGITACDTFSFWTEH